MTTKGRRWIIVVAAAAVILAVGVFIFSDRSPRVSVEYLGSESGNELFLIHSESRYRIEYRTGVEVKQGDAWPTYPEGTVLSFYGERQVLEAHATARVIFPERSARNWRLSVAAFRADQRLNERLAGWFRDHGLIAIADRIPQSQRAFVATSPEITK